MHHNTLCNNGLWPLRAWRVKHGDTRQDIACSYSYNRVSNRVQSSFAPRTAFARAMVKKHAASLIPVERIERAILLIRGHKVMLDRDLATLYGVKAIALRQQVSRNEARFPPDFMFRLTQEEAEALVSQNVIPSMQPGRIAFVCLRGVNGYKADYPWAQ